MSKVATAWFPEARSEDVTTQLRLIGRIRAGVPFKDLSHVLQLTRGHYAPTLYRSSAASHSTLPQRGLELCFFGTIFGSGPIISVG